MSEDIYDKYLTMSQSDPERAYYGLAKVTDQRLVTLEHARNEERNIKGAKSATNYAYKYAMHELHSLYGEGVTRFNKKVGEKDLVDNGGNVTDINQVYQARINAMLTFLSLPTSTIGGLRDTYQKISDSLNRDYAEQMGFEFTPDNIGDFFESDAYQDFENYGSETIFNAIATYKENEKEIAERIRDYSETHTHANGEIDFSDFRLDIGANADYEKIITEMVREHNVRSLDDMYKGFDVKE